MAQEYIRGVSNLHGNVEIANTVIESIARLGAQEVEGAIIADGSFKKGVTVNMEKGSTVIHVDIKISYGFNADRVARQIQERIIQDVRQMADVIVDQVNVNVLGFQF